MEKDKKDKIRPPVVTLMGHVDHGKTTLLDAVRKTNIVAREHGGITQHIGAYQITFQGNLITFIDTPGHAAFERMRSRGAEVADIVILVVAANDSVKPQTVEAINHIKKAQKPTIVAITKTDLGDINIEKVKKDLQTHDIIVEGYGGEVPLVEVAAPKGKGIADLLEVISLVWQISPEVSLPDDSLEAVVIESFLDKNRGVIVSVINKKGSLKVGQRIEVDGVEITVKALIDDRGKNVKEAESGKPVEILGFKKVLEVGSVIHDFTKSKEDDVQKAVTPLDLIAKSLEIKDKFKVIVKADVLGSLEAICSNLPEEILVVSSGVGDVQSVDVNFAKVSGAPILAFNVKVPGLVKKQIDQEQVVVRNYRVIYELISDMEDVVKSFEQTKHELKIQGKGKVVAIFDIEGKKIAGVKVTNGKVKMGDKVILKPAVGEGRKAEVISLKRFKKDVKTVVAGQECGIGLEPNLDFKDGDIIESLG